VLLLSAAQELTTGVPTMIIDWGLLPERLTESLINGSLKDVGYNLLTLFTSTFLHGGLDHFFNNMVLLVLLGFVVEREFGSLRFTGIYLASGVLGSLAHYMFHALSPYPMIGASGAISGIMGAFLIAVFATGQRITFWRLLGAVFVAQWVIEQLVSVFAYSGARSGIAYGAHLGGFVAGVIVAWLVTRGLRASRKTFKRDDEPFNRLQFAPQEPDQNFGSVNQTPPADPNPASPEEKDKPDRLSD